MGEAVIIADAGGTKTQWLFYPSFTEGEEGVMIVTQGINAAVMSRETIADRIQDLYAKINSFKSDIKSCRLYFYGAGCNSEPIILRLNQAFAENFPITLTTEEYYSDIVGAAHALFGRDEGVVCILGTGSASGIYDGKSLVDSIPSLGFILGDEGSGAFMGKTLLNMAYKRELPNNIKEKLEESYGLDLPSVIENVYRKPNANRYLATFVPFIKENEHIGEISGMIDYSLKLFFEKNVLKYKKLPNKTLRFAGGVASLFSNRIVRIAKEHGLKADRFIQNPIFELSEYHLKENFLKI